VSSVATADTDGILEPPAMRLSSQIRLRDEWLPPMGDQPFTPKYHSLQH
jgi:hypothetical protein